MDISNFTESHYVFQWFNTNEIVGNTELFLNSMRNSNTGVIQLLMDDSKSNPADIVNVIQLNLHVHLTFYAHIK